jgi:hypothetical protein
MAHVRQSMDVTKQRPPVNTGFKQPDPMLVSRYTLNPKP